MPVPTGHLIGGQWVDSPSTFETRSPLDWGGPDDPPLARVDRGDDATADAAVAAAVEGFATWGSWTPRQRAEVLHRLADLIEAHTDDIAMVECLDMGFRLESMQQRLVARGALNFRLYADLVVEHAEREWDAKAMHNWVQRMPAGPAVVITPWNAPFMLSTWKLAPALASGNTVIHKPAEWSPLSAAILAELAVEAGFPAGAYNLVQGIGEEVGAALVADPRVRRITFTGLARDRPPHRARGRREHRAVHRRARWQGAIRRLRRRRSRRRCAPCGVAVRRRRVRCAWPAPVCSSRHRCATSSSSVSTARSTRWCSATAAIPRSTSRRWCTPTTATRCTRSSSAPVPPATPSCAAARPIEGSLHYEPTLIEPASNDSEVVQREVFGPVLTFQTFADEAEAIALANTTAYGLSAIVYTSSRARAERVGRAHPRGPGVGQHVPRA